MATSPNAPFSLREKIGLVFLLLCAPPQILLNLARVLTLAFTRGLPLRYYLHCALFRFVLSVPTARQVQFLTPSTAQAYTSFLASRRRKALAAADSYLAARLTSPDITPLPDGASSLLWLGDRARATKVVYFLHGGGYYVALQDGHLEWCLRAYILAARARSGDEVAVACLQYSLSPGAKYPTQLCQAAAGLAQILKSGVRPRDIIFGGDSAGGNLTAQLLSHLLHPHPKAECIVLAEPLAGAFAVSPWVSARRTDASFRANRYIDMLSPEILGIAVEYLVGGVAEYEEETARGEGWAMPGDVDGAWFAGLEAIVRELYVTVGEQEVLRDQGVKFAETVRKVSPGVGVRLELLRNEAHDFILLEGGSKEEGEATGRMRKWAEDVLFQ
ncbi:Alpha/Beta hydrolase protein [Podospora appendiculata]|uniref:Alpha/Beta hydrolase protein n=1 Tax=Podospora appendiculata TaxID=314037 RepID=A0AAE0XD42_9PEZI|nr:Alpha/Beta hydrolase protein [Podospora appendiculata]